MDLKTKLLLAYSINSCGFIDMDEKLYGVVVSQVDPKVPKAWRFHQASINRDSP